MVRVTEVVRVATVTGAGSANRTDRFGVHGTDLGIIWANGPDEVLVAFGDSYGSGWGGNGAGPAEADWRCNIVTRSRNRDLDRGLDLEPVARRPDGTAEQAIPRDPSRPREQTVIPTSGLNVAGTNYLHYMSVSRWGEPGHWETDHGGIAVSTDGGVSWQRPDSARWPGRPRRSGLFGSAREHPFQLAACAGQADGSVYLLGTPAGRFGSATAARVPADRVLEPAAYRYWDGRDFAAADPFDARPVFAGPVGELSVRYHEPSGQWLALHLDERRAALVLRSAPELTGPWDDGVVVASARDHPAPYGGYLHPWSTGSSVHFTLSQWGPYNVSLLRATIAG
jgi:hypothetical protein